MKEIILDTLARKKWMSVSEFVSLCLYHPKLGYYQKSNPFGMGGDFVTSPQISTIFGELIGLYFAYQFKEHYSKESFNRCIFIELGSGNGFFLRDMLKSTSRVEGFKENTEIFSVEISDKLTKEQKYLLEPFVKNGHDITWLKDPTDLIGDMEDEDNFIMIFSNEFIDAFPVNQYVHNSGQWNEIVVINKDDNLMFAVHEVDSTLKVQKYLNLTNREEGSIENGGIVEVSNQSSTIFALLCKTLTKHMGCMMTVDYGYTVAPLVSTLRGIKDHKEVDIFENPGECDLTYLVDFEFLQALALTHDLRVYEPIPQGEFLKSIGIEERAKIALNAEQDEAKRYMIEKSIERLTSPKHMGDLFKVLIMENL